MNLGQVFTNEYVANYMTSLFSIPKKSPILDPCFGEGVFIKSLIDNGFSNITGIEIDYNLFQCANKNFKNLILLNRDFLMSPCKSKYDGIIMNPPYIRHEEINELKTYGITKEKLLNNKLFKDLTPKSNLYMYFIIKAISLLKINGELVVIFPSSWLNAKNGDCFKRIITKNCFIEEHINISGNVFNRKALVDVIILKIKKSKNKKPTLFKNFNFDGKEIYYRNQPPKIIIQFNKNFTEIASIKRGLTTGYNEMFINPPIKNKANLVPIVSSPKQIKGYSIKDSKYDYLFELQEFDLETKKYINGYKNKIISMQKPKTLFDKIISNDKKWFFIKPTKYDGIVFSYFIRNDIKFILNESSMVIRDNFYVITPKINKYILFALLNNYYTYYQLECVGKKYGNGLLKIQSYDIKNLTFPMIESNSDMKKLEELAKSLIKTNNEDIIYEITDIISKYTNVSSTTICEGYFSIKKYRLEEKI